jgi:hypothetical protein
VDLAQRNDDDDVPGVLFDRFDVDQLPRSVLPIFDVYLAVRFRAKIELLIHQITLGVNQDFAQLVCDEC